MTLSLETGRSLETLDEVVAVLGDALARAKENLIGGKHPRPVYAKVGDLTECIPGADGKGTIERIPELGKIQIPGMTPQQAVANALTQVCGKSRMLLSDDDKRNMFVVKVDLDTCSPLTKKDDRLVRNDSVSRLMAVLSLGKVEKIGSVFEQLQQAAEVVLTEPARPDIHERDPIKLLGDTRIKLQDAVGIARLGQPVFSDDEGRFYIGDCGRRAMAVREARLQKAGTVKPFLDSWRGVIKKHSPDALAVWIGGGTTDSVVELNFHDIVIPKLGTQFHFIEVPTAARQDLAGTASPEAVSR